MFNRVWVLQEFGARMFFGGRAALIPKDTDMNVVLKRILKMLKIDIT